MGGSNTQMQTISQLFDLTGKAAIVTGGAKGIGQAIAFRLSEAGAGVMIADIDLEAAAETVERIKEKGGDATFVSADARSATDAENVVSATLDKFGTLDLLINNAGIFPISPVFETTETLWNQVIDINLKGVFLYSQVAAKVMAQAEDGGKIINLASVDAIKPTGMLAHYNASKGGVLMLTKALALELAPMNIRVNAVAPGGINTPGVQGFWSNIPETVEINAEEAAAEFLKRVPLGRTGEPDDIAKVVLFLASGASDYMTGEIMVVDGGHLLT
jgi:2-deoxy-D-gluconate 3-dehydrogenase